MGRNLTSVMHIDKYKDNLLNELAAIPDTELTEEQRRHYLEMFMMLSKLPFIQRFNNKSGQ